MNRRRYTEDQAVQKPAAALLAELGWRSVVAFNEPRLSISPEPDPEGCRFHQRFLMDTIGNSQ